jgi:hypothetical protein
MAVHIFAYFTFKLLFKFRKNLEKNTNAKYEVLFAPQYMLLSTKLKFLGTCQQTPISDIIKVK